MIRKVSNKQARIKREDYYFFKKIWDERPHESEISGEPLPYFFGRNMFFVFSHILSKGAYPRFRHYDKNIVLMTFQEHREWEDGNRLGSKWDWVFELHEELKQEYNQKL